MKKIAILTLALLLAACDDPSAVREDAPIMPKIEGCQLERHQVKSPRTGTEVLYVARCAPSKTTSVTAQYNCGKGCTKKVTTITTIEGTPEEQK